MKVNRANTRQDETVKKTLDYLGLLTNQNKRKYEAARQAKAAQNEALRAMGFEDYATEE
jgi:hypothetical protein